ncbi:hypothetical protein [Streptomyces sp. 4F14]|uniref:hypothetical protein n=1 Tax=Streptomyces sp. 4F14 TaxID=3394380 RepID=UPI003A8B5C5F
MNESEIYGELLALLAGPADYWDRPAGDWPAQSSGIEDFTYDERVARQDANAAYLLGTKALRGNDLQSAGAWFEVACDQQHPGAAFRAVLTHLLPLVCAESIVHGQAGVSQSGPDLALLTVPTGSSKTRTLMHPVVGGKGRVLFLLTAAAKWGHGDAQHLVGRLQNSAGESVADLAWPAGELPPVVDDNLAGTVLVADRLPYEPEDLEFYPATRALLEQCFGDHRHASQPLTLHGGQRDVVEHHAIASPHTLRDADSGQGPHFSGGLPWAERWHSRWRSLAGKDQGRGSFRQPGSYTGWLAPRLFDNAWAELFLPDVPFRLWARSCCQEADTPWAEAIGHGQCPRCADELTPFTGVLFGVLGTDRQPPLSDLPRTVQKLRHLRRAREMLQRSEWFQVGSHCSFFWDAPQFFSVEAPMTVGTQGMRSRPGSIRSSTRPPRTAHEYLYGSIESSPSTGAGGFAARGGQWQELCQDPQQHEAAERALVLATAILDGVDIWHVEQAATSLVVSVKELATGFDPPRPSRLHVVRDTAHRLYLFADPLGSPGDQEEPQLIVPSVVTSPRDSAGETAQPITMASAPGTDRSDPKVLSRPDQLQVYALDA